MEILVTKIRWVVSLIKKSDTNQSDGNLRCTMVALVKDFKLAVYESYEKENIFTLDIRDNNSSMNYDIKSFVFTADRNNFNEIQQKAENLYINFLLQNINFMLLSK